MRRLGRGWARGAALLALLGAAVLAAASGGGRSAAVVRSAFVPNDTFFGGYSWPARSANLLRAWNLTLGSPSVTIAVLDTGVSPGPDLAGALVPGHDFVRGGTDTTDDNGHGTEVATIAAARIGNGLGVAGVCGRCSVMPVKVLDAKGDGDTATVAKGIAWAVDHGADIVNLSLATSTDDHALAAAISDAVARGVTVVLAAGNAGSADPALGGYPAAASAGAIRVGGIDRRNLLYPWSNRGGWVDVAAPGAAAAATLQGSFFLGVSGTSVAAPIVAGIAGLVLSREPGLTPAAVKSLIETTGTPVPGLAVASGRRVDAYAALVGAARLAASPAPRAP